MILNQKKVMYPFVGICMFLSNAQMLYGDVKLHDTEISQEVKIVGMGSMKNAVFDKSVSVVGFLNSESSHFLSDVYLTGSDLVLRNDHIDGDVHITNYLKKPKLRMQQSTIKGKVVFHGRKPGKVEKDKDSTIERGVENGDET